MYNAYCIIADRARPDRSRLCPWYPKLVDSKGRWLETYCLKTAVTGLALGFVNLWTYVLGFVARV